MLTEKLPKSLSKLTQNLPLEQLILVHQIRKQILEYSDDLIEMPKSTYTWYGFKKNDKEIYTSYACALFKSVQLQQYPHLVLRLPYQRYKGIYVPGQGGARRVKELGLSWMEVNIYGGTWLSVLLDNPRKERPSTNIKWEQYQDMASHLLEKELKLEAVEDFVSLALEQWKWTILTKKKQNL